MFFTVNELATYVGGVVSGNKEHIVTGVASLEKAKQEHITFALDKEKIKSTQAGCVFVKDVLQDVKINQIIVNDPYYAFIQVLKIVEKEIRVQLKPGIHQNAVIGKNVKLEDNVSIGAFVYIGENTKIGSGAIIYPSVYIGENVQIGSNCLIYPHVSIREHIIIGSNAIIHCGTVIGSDGYAYRQIKGQHIKIPQVGKVVIGDDVEIGANVCIDRATIENTFIDNGTKIDNLVQIGHNVKIGKNVLFAAQVGIAGSSKISDYAVLAGQVGVKDHVNIGECAIIGAKSGVIGDIKPNAKVWGIPARDIKEKLKNDAYVNMLPDLKKQIKELEKRIEEIECKNIKGEIHKII